MLKKTILSGKNNGLVGKAGGRWGNLCKAISLKDTRKNQIIKGRNKREKSIRKLVCNLGVSRRFPVPFAYVSRRFPVLRTTGNLREMYAKCTRKGGIVYQYSFSISCVIWNAWDALLITVILHHNAKKTLYFSTPQVCRLIQNNGENRLN